MFYLYGEHFFYFLSPEMRSMSGLYATGSSKMLSALHTSTISDCRFLKYANAGGVKTAKIVAKINLF